MTTNWCLRPYISWLSTGARLAGEAACIQEEKMATTVDVQELEAKVKDMYRHVAEEPQGEYHFELGRPLAEHLGYPADILDRIPAGAIESFAGVGYFFDLADLSEGESVVDLGSGSGMDVFFAADRVGQSGSVVGIDFTVEQLEKARRIAEESGFAQVELREGRIEKLSVEGASCDCMISNGVINLAPEKAPVFAEAARVLKPGGRLAIADIVSEHQMKESIVCDADLWASCIGGAAQQDAYREAIEAAGLRIEEIRDNPYEFISDRARDASAKYGVKSVSLLAIKS
jgi:arsenite methyltransferase